MAEEYRPTSPRPFIFVLMPFDEEFDDVYEMIRDAAKAVGAYAERVDKQMFEEGILERIFNQVSRADALVADMSELSVNVFYEVGYAHALGKIVVLLTQDPEHIPFDLKHRQHLLYSRAKIAALRDELAARLQWAIEEGQKQSRPRLQERFVVSTLKEEIPEAGEGGKAPIISLDVPKDVGALELPIAIRNASRAASPPVEFICLLTEPDPDIAPAKRLPELPVFHQNMEALHPMVSPGNEDETLEQYRLPAQIPSLPPGAAEQVLVGFLTGRRSGLATVSLRLRLHTSANIHDFPFSIFASIG